MSRINVHSLVFIFAAPLVFCLEAVGQAEPPALPVVLERPVVLAVTVNGLPGDLGSVFFQNDAGHIFAPASFLNVWNFRAGELRAFAADGTVYFDLSGIQGLIYEWNQATAELLIRAEPDAFLANHINVGAGLAAPVPHYKPGGYLNYEISANHSPGARTYGGLFDGGMFLGSGMITNSVLADSRRRARLMTTWQGDRMESLKTLRIGDSTNSTGAWGRGVLFGGIQYGTNFAIRPDFITSAMPSVSGQALLPSTIDVYVNQALRDRAEVNAGPFSIQNLPGITGTGEVQLVVTDVLGREQVITQSFFASPNLLREGLVEDSYEFGWQRQNYGIKSIDYRDPFATATYRKGLNDRLTAEARIELQKDRAAGGITAATMLPAISSIIESSVAISGGKGLSPGVLTSLNYSYLGQRWTYNTRLQLNSTGFRQLGSDPANLLRQLITAQLSMPLGVGTMSVNYLRRMNQGESLVRVVNVSYSRRLGERVFASLTVLKPLSKGGGSVTAALGVTMFFDSTHYGSSTINRQSGAANVSSDFQQLAPRDDGVGYRLAMQNGGANPRQEVSATLSRPFASYQAEVVRVQGAVSSRFTATGGIAELREGLHFSRGIENPFAIVQIADYAGVPVYLENQEVSRTDRGGQAIVTNLLSYQPNRISIDPLKLPMEASVNEIEKIVIPRTLQGQKVIFDVRKVRSATLKIVLASGAPLPPWTTVEVAGTDRSFVSGKRGEVFVELPNIKGNRVTAHLPGDVSCELAVDLPDAVTLAPFLGPLTCAQSQ